MAQSVIGKWQGTRKNKCTSGLGFIGIASYELPAAQAACTYRGRRAASVMRPRAPRVAGTSRFITLTEVVKCSGVFCESERQTQLRGVEECRDSRASWVRLCSA